MLPEFSPAKPARVTGAFSWAASVASRPTA